MFILELMLISQDQDKQLGHWSKDQLEKWDSLHRKTQDFEKRMKIRSVFLICLEKDKKELKK